MCLSFAQEGANLSQICGDALQYKVEECKPQRSLIFFLINLLYVHFSLCLFACYFVLGVIQSIIYSLLLRTECIKEVSGTVA